MLTLFASASLIYIAFLARAAWYGIAAPVDVATFVWLPILLAGWAEAWATARCQLYQDFAHQLTRICQKVISCFTAFRKMDHTPSAIKVSAVNYGALLFLGAARFQSDSSLH